MKLTNHYTPGTYNSVCESCGKVTKAYLLRTRWDGKRVCHKDYETDHPQKYIRVHQDTSPADFPRHDITDVFIEVTEITPPDVTPPPSYQQQWHMIIVGPNGQEVHLYNGQDTLPGFISGALYVGDQLLYVDDQILSVG